MEEVFMGETSVHVNVSETSRESSNVMTTTNNILSRQYLHGKLRSGEATEETEI